MKTRLNIDMLEEKFTNNEKIRKFQETSKEFDKLVEQGLAERRGNRLLSTSDAHLKRQVRFNVKIEDNEENGLYNE